MNTKSRVGSFTPVIQDVSKIYSQIFDHSSVIRREIKSFVETFEENRGEDGMALVKSVQVANYGNEVQDTLANNTEHLSTISLEVQKVTEMINKTLQKQESYESARLEERQQNEPKEIEIVNLYLKQFEEQKEKAKRDYEEKRKELFIKYKHIIPLLPLNE
eukprot:TRINITY_DN17133_c0_g1_i1.p1 TRINITY_DN17133_c0_g1~~TRINITY_DN17133_c0_g1_i1.p1  ORF type:complete len:161 (+),score=49.95 TRINITY_DN17133_c0_g1_i1:14-496(+)